MESHPSSDLGDRLDLPVPLVEVPPSPTVKSLAEAVLYTLGDPLWSHGNTFAKSVRFREICEKCNVRMLGLDDVQHLVDSKRNVPFEAAEWLKEQLIKTKISIVVFGLERSLEILRQNEQLRRRFGTPIRIGEFRWEVKEEREHYRAFLRAVTTGLPNFTMPSADLDFCYRMNYASFGLVGYSMKIIRGAVKIARAKQSTEMTMKMFQQAYRIHVWDERLTGLNPFSEEFNPKTAPKRELPMAKEPDIPVKPRGRKARLKLVA